MWTRTKTLNSYIPRHANSTNSTIEHNIETYGGVP